MGDNRRNPVEAVTGERGASIELERTLPSGATIRARPAVPADEPRLARYFEQLSPESLVWRANGEAPGLVLSAARERRVVVTIDAGDPASGAVVVGEGVWRVDGRATFALSVADRWWRVLPPAQRGDPARLYNRVAGVLLDALEASADRAGARTADVAILAGNAAVAGLLDRRGAHPLADGRYLRFRYALMPPVLLPVAPRRRYLVADLIDGYGLTERETAALAVIAQRHAVAEVAERLELPVSVAAILVSAVVGKLRAADRAGALGHARDVGLIGLPGALGPD